ncbi:Cytochrome P450 monooxygenase cicH [Exophiala dermatitidis]
MPVSITYLPLLGLALTVLYLLSNRYQKGLWRIPGPWLRSLSTIPRMWAIYRSHSHKYDIELHRKYGKVVRVAPNILSVSDTAEINQLYGITTKFVKSGFYSLSEVFDEKGELMPDPFILKDKTVHTRMKRNAANAYSLNALVQMEPYVDEVTTHLLSILDRYAEAGQVCNIGDVAKNYAMDAITSITFGRNFNYLDKGDTLRFYKTLDIFTDYMAIFGQIPWIHPYLLKNPRIAQWWVGEDSSQAEMIALSSSEIEKGRQRTAEDGPMTFLERLLLNQKSNPKSITDHEMLTHAWGNLAAGSDTTGTAIRSLIYYVLKHERVYKQLCEEVRAKLTLPVPFADANALPYLTACIKESMRMHPSVGLILGRTTPPGGATISGHYVPAGTEVGMNPYVLHYDPDVFPNPDTFRPERWLPAESSEDHLRQMNRSFFAFGHGAHTCSGRHISMLEITKLMPTLLLRYDLELVDGGKDYKFKNRWFTPQEGLLVTLTRRAETAAGSGRSRSG